MATVPELKIIAKSLGIIGYSRMTKPELEKIIGDKTAENRERYGRSGLPAESDSKPVTDPAPTDPKAQRREAARLAGSLAKVTAPMDNHARALNYDGQRSGAATPAMVRRMRKKGNKARGFNGCTLAQYREVKRRMRKAGML